MLHLVGERERSASHLPGATWTSYTELINNEQAFREKMSRFLDEHAFEHVDTLPFLRQKFQEGKQPYHVSRDGHPSPPGHTAIAEAVARTLQHQAKAPAEARP